MSLPNAERPVRLLHVNPVLPESFWSFRWWIDMVPGKRAINLPLGLATLAGLCPPHWQVSIVDENVQSLPLEPEADLVGVCGMGAQFERQREILRYYRGRGLPTVAGGSFASLCPEEYTELADYVVAGEAEYIWPAFCRDYVHRHFSEDPLRTQQLVHKTAAWLRKRYAASLQQGLPKVTEVLKSGGAELQLIFPGHIVRVMPPRAMRRLERLLKHSTATLSLRIEELGADQYEQIHALLQRLEPYGQRVSI